MHRFQRILVVPLTNQTDPPPALTEAVSLAGSSGAKVEILGHLDQPPACQQEIEERHSSALRDAARSTLLQRLARWADDVRRPGLEIDIATGSLTTEISDRVRRDGHDLVVIAGDDSNESAAAARRILRTCPCPSWVLRPGFAGHRVLAAIDPDHGEEHNRLVLELARSQAEIHNGQLHVMHAWGVAGLELLSDDDLQDERVTEVVTAAEAAHRTSFDRTLDHAGIAPRPTTHLVEGPPARAIQVLTLRYRVDLVVLGSGAWNEPWLGLGSTAEQVLAESQSSVLLVR